MIQDVSTNIVVISIAIISNLNCSDSSCVGKGFALPSSLVIRRTNGVSELRCNGCLELSTFFLAAMIAMGIVGPTIVQNSILVIFLGLGMLFNYLSCGGFSMAHHWAIIR